MLSEEPALLKANALHLQKIKMVIKYLNSLLNISAKTEIFTAFIVTNPLGSFVNVVGLSASVTHPSYL